jgi:hypothetical protein
MRLKVTKSTDQDQYLVFGVDAILEVGVFVATIVTVGVVDITV